MTACFPLYKAGIAELALQKEASSIITQSNIPGFSGRMFERKLSFEAQTGKIANSN